MQNEKIISKDAEEEIISEEQTKKNFEVFLRECFLVFDKNKDGQIDRYEIKTVMAMLGERVSDVEVDRIIVKGDASKTGTLSFEEFNKLIHSFIEKK